MSHKEREVERSFYSETWPRLEPGREREREREREKKIGARGIACLRHCLSKTNQSVVQGWI